MRKYTLTPLLAALVFAVSAAMIAAQPAARTAEAAPTDGITDVRVGDHITYERAVLDFENSPTGEPPAFSWNYKAGDTVVRLRLPETRATDITNGPALGRAISHYNVVRAKPGWLYVDLHLTGAARYVNIFTLDDPGRIVIDVTPSGVQRYMGPIHDNETFVMAPRPWSWVGPDKLRVVGYGRSFEASGVWRIKDYRGQIVSRGTYTTADWATTWGSYVFQADYPAAMSGQWGTLEMGAASARDGSFDGVSVPLIFR